MLPYRIFDHALVGRDHKRCLRHEQKQTDRLERLDRSFGQTAIQIVNQNHQTINICATQKLLKLLPERMHLLRGGFKFGLFQILSGLHGDGL